MPVVHNTRDKTAPEGAVYIGRPSKWGNPFTIGRDGTRADVVRKYRAWLPTQTKLVEDAKTELRGRDLVCFCAPEECHGDVLLELANSVTSATYTIYCDGASRKDGRGGWGASIRRPGAPNVDLYGGEYDTTNNRMELMGALEALWYIPEHSVVHVYGDSEYVVKGASEYLDTWARTGWRTTANKPLKNDDLWQEMQGAIARHALVEWFWVRGHSGDEGNERADALSQMGVPKPR